LLLGTGVVAALAQSTLQRTTPNPPASLTAPLPGTLTSSTQGPPPAAPQGGTSLVMRGLDKITGRPTSITAPIGKQVAFATLTITARFCYSTPPSETPETAAFVQIEDHRPDQPARRVFSGWMYASSPGLNGVEHPLYDVWVISCNNAPASAVAANTSTAPVKVKAPASNLVRRISPNPAGPFAISASSRSLRGSTRPVISTSSVRAGFRPRRNA
jgi:hypothetical protein